MDTQVIILCAAAASVVINLCRLIMSCRRQVSCQPEFRFEDRYSRIEALLVEHARLNLV